MTIGSDNLGNGSSTTQERFGGYRSLRDGGALPGEPSDADLLPRNGTGLSHDADLDRGRPSLNLDGLEEPVFTEPQTWLDPGIPLADHPLLRGLLLELPPKGALPPPGWLDRWFEAARCILELLYASEHGRSH